jgi:hypothetical protein
VINGKSKIKIKYYFGSSILVLHALKEVLNKMSKYLFYFKNIIPTYLSKKLKPIK